MNLENRIKEDLKTALKDGKKTDVSTLRMVISCIKNKRIDEMVKGDLDDSKVIGVIQKMVSQHKESIQQFKSGGREDLVTKETEELKVLENYLPQPVSQEELIAIVKEVITRTGASSMKNMGTVVKEVMEKAAGRADGKTISQMVKELLS